MEAVRTDDRRVYERAKNWRDTQADIAKLFQRHGIGDVQWSVSETYHKAALSFAKTFPAKQRWDSETKKIVETEPRRQIVVQLVVPIKDEGKDRNVAFRVLYWYLKSKLEAVEFHFQDGSELFSFEREFFGHTMIQDVHGNTQSAFDAFKSGDIDLALPSSVIALPPGSDKA